MPAHVPRLALLAVLAVGDLSACCPSSTTRPGPDHALRTYAGHLQEGRTEPAHRMLSRQKRQATSPDTLARLLDAGGDDLQAQLDAWRTPGEQRVTMCARVRDPAGRTTFLVREGDSWKVDHGPLVPPLGFTPETALERFLRAAEAGDCEALVDCAPPQIRARHERQRLLEGCREQLATVRRTAARIRAGGGRLTRVAPDRYELVYDQHRKLVVVEYHGRWYVQDL